MRQPSKSPPNHDAVLSSSPLHRDGKCQNCRELMSRCMCFLESETDPLDTSTFSEAIADASQSRPLWNALRKMHRTSTATHQSIMQQSTSSQPSRFMSKKQHCKRSEALPSVKATRSTSKPRHHVDQRSDARPSQSSKRDRREPRDGHSLNDASLCRKDGLQRAGVTRSSHNLKRDVKDGGVMRSVQSTYSIKHNSVDHPKENFRYGLKEGLRPSDDNDGTVWEL